MEQLEQRGHPAVTASLVARGAAAAAGAAAVGAAVAVVVLRALNDDDEPLGQNWWLVALLLVAVTYAPAGPGLATRPGRRALGAAVTFVGLGAAVTAVATQYGGYEVVRDGPRDLAWAGSAAEWSLPATAGVLAAVVPWIVVPSAARPVRRFAIAVASAAVVAVAVVEGVVDGPPWIGTVAAWLVAASATAAVVHLALWCRDRRLGPPDPLPAWILAGATVAWFAVVPPMVDVLEWRLPGRHVVGALLLLATVPLLLGGALVDAMRDGVSSFLGISSRVLEWVVLTTGIIGVYTVLVAGLGRLVGGAGPTWFLVATTGAIALALEPARRRVRRLVDQLIYGARDDPLAVVQRVVDHLGADQGDTLLPALVQSLRTELRLDTVAIDLRTGDGWRPGASTGPATAQRRVVPLVHGGEVVGRLVVGWTEGPALRPRDEDILDQLVGPLSLAVGWVRLAEDLRRSSVAIVSTREEERRRLRRDLHDGLGPSLTGVSLGLRTALRQLERRSGADPGPAPRRLLERVADEVDTAVVDLKRIVRDLRPTALDQVGLVEAVAEFTRAFGDTLDITLALPSEPVRLPAAVEIATYRIVTEAVTNVVRHARAARCWLSIETGATVVIDVVDDGVGIRAHGPAGVGLAAMRERAAELGGTVDVGASAPHGTRVHVQIPVALP